MLKCKLVEEISENNDYNLCMFLKKNLYCMALEDFEFTCTKLTWFTVVVLFFFHLNNYFVNAL